jgi:ferric-dicitrate binding protein FerR (iron transport regulator)
MQPAKTHSPAPAPGTRRGWLRALGWFAAVAVCLGVFAMYTVPDFMVMVADKVWSCF